MKFKVDLQFVPNYTFYKEEWKIILKIIEKIYK